MSNTIDAENASDEPSPVELFTPRQRISMPGQDPNRCEQLYGELCRYFSPRDPIEGMWVNDVAVITARIEFLRKSHRAATLVALRREVRANPHFTGDISPAEAEIAAAEVLTDTYNLKTKPGSSGSEENLPIVRLLGTMSMKSLRQEEDFMGLEFAALRERDRIIGQIGKKRSEEMRAALKLIQAPTEDDDVTE